MNTPLPPRRGAFVRDDLEAMPDDGRRYEIVDGMLLVSAPPGRLHQRVVGQLLVPLHDAWPPEFEVLVAPFDVVLANDTVFEPDVLVAGRSRLTDRDLPGAPELAVEVLSPSTRQIDLHVKRERLASLVAWQLTEGNRYQQIAEVAGDKEFHATLPYPVTVVPAALVR